MRIYLDGKEIERKQDESYLVEYKKRKNTRATIYIGNKVMKAWAYYGIDYKDGEMALFFYKKRPDAICK